MRNLPMRSNTMSKQILIMSVISTCISALIATVSATVDTPYEVGTWANFCQGAVSHTFDDNTTGQTTIAQPLFDAKGFHMTLFTVTGAMNPNWVNLKNAFAKGHEIASHSVTHPSTMPGSECAPSQKTIQQNVPGELCVTIAYPNCNIPTDLTDLKKCYIGGRICDGQIVPKTPSNFYLISSKIAGSAGINTVDGLNKAANDAATSGGWVVFLHHGVENDNHGYSNTPKAVIQGNLDFLDQNRSKIWTETFGNVVRYIKERNAVSVTVKSSNDNSITLSVTDDLDNTIFNYPLSIRRPLPDGWTEAIVTQKNSSVADTILTVNSKKYVMFKVVPDGGDVVISKNPTAVLKHTLTYGTDGNSLVRKTHASLIIDANQFSGSNLNVTLFDLNGKLIASYHVAPDRSSVLLPEDKLHHSAFVVKITDGCKTYVKTFMASM